MKKLIIISAFSLLPIICFSQAEKSDEEAIIDLVNTEVSAYLQHDFEAWSACWLHQSYVHHNYTTSSYHEGLQGWEALKNSTANEFKALPDPNFKVEKTNFKVTVFENTAFASFNEIYKNLTADEKDVWTAINNAVFEKQNDEWKIVGYNIVNQTTFNATEYDVMANLNLAGNMLMEMNKTNEALRVFDLCMEIQPESCEKYNKLGEVFLNMGKEDLARQYFKKCLIIEPKNEVAIGKIEQIDEE